MIIFGSTLSCKWVLLFRDACVHQCKTQTTTYSNSSHSGPFQNFMVDFNNDYIQRRWNSMMTSSNGHIFRVTGHFCGEFTVSRSIPRTQPGTRGFDVFFDLRLNKRLSKQSWGWWFEALSRPLWRHCNDQWSGSMQWWSSFLNTK